MQIPKDNIKKQVFEAAREEFIKNGFKDASMRTIAKKAKVTLSNIYNYYSNKEEIFQDVLKPLLQNLEKVKEEHNNPKNITVEYFSSEKYQLEHINQYLELIINYKEELNVLLFKAHGSSFEN